jgi:hypothetical protein
MKHFRFLLLNIFIFGLLAFLLSLLFPGTVSTSKSININASQQQIAHILKDTDNSAKWNVIANSPSTKTTITSVQGDSMIMAEITNGNQMLMNQFNLTSYDQSTTAVHYTIIQNNAWYKPWKKLLLLFSEGKFGKPMELSLQNLKSLAEKK